MKELTIIEDGALLIRDGIIQEVGPTRRIERLAEARDAIVVEASGKVVMPCFVDSYTQLLNSFEGSTRSWSRSRRENEVRERLQWFVRHGTATLETRIREYKELRILKHLHLCGLQAIPTLSVQSGQEVRFLKDWGPRIRLGDWGPSFFPDLDVDYLIQQKQEGVSIHLHGGATDEVALRSGVFTWTQPEIRSDQSSALAASSVIPVILPILSYQGIQGNDLARTLIDQEGTLALASGFNGGPYRTLSMPMVISLACSRLRMTEAESIVASTINGACALGLSRKTGSLETGKDADLVMLNIADYRELAGNVGMNQVVFTMKRGKILFNEMRERIWND